MFDSSFRLSHWMDLIERVQYMAALAVTGTWEGTSCNKIYEQLGWESLSEDGFIGLFNFFKYKMVSLPLTLKPQFRVHEIIFSVPEMKMTFTVLNVEQTCTCTAFILIL